MIQAFSSGATMKIVVTALVISACCASPVAADTLHLICQGAGLANKDDYNSAYMQDSTGNSAWGQTMSEHAVPFQDQVDVELDEGTGRVRMPRTMLPTLHGGSEGWFEIKKVKWSDTAITGVVQVNILNSPKLRVDRLTGRISINGKSGDYTGECQPYDPAAVQRKF
jgi:hypothetical protein